MKELHELKLIKELAEVDDDLVTIKKLAEVEAEGEVFPIISFSIGTQDKNAPVLALFGGVHGLERVGTHVVITYLTSLFKQLEWDNELRSVFESCRIVSIPLINPAGMALHKRSNANNVDLMRNAPGDEKLESPTFLVSGHRISPKLPWYRGKLDDPMELESQTLVDFCREQFFDASVCLSIDFHSGFGMKDRLWFPYAKTSTPFSRIQEVGNLCKLLDQTHPYHIYQIEPQYESYTINGDLWDYIFDLFQEHNRDKNKTFIPWTLEMGSWIWVKKNPLQVFLAGGFFNPIKSHRFDRTMRRHMVLIDFFFRASRNYQSWI